MRISPGKSQSPKPRGFPEAAIFAARRAATSVSMEDFERATERVIGGLPKPLGGQRSQPV